MAYKGYYFEFNDDHGDEEYFIYNTETDHLVGGANTTEECENIVDVMIEQNVKHESQIDWSRA